MLRQKSAGLDIDDPMAQKMLQPASTNWNRRSDMLNMTQKMNHLMKLSGNLVSREGTSEAETRDCTEKPSKKPAPRSELLFQRIKERYNRYTRNKLLVILNILSQLPMVLYLGKPAEKPESRKATGRRKLPRPPTLTSLRKKLEKMDKCPGPSKAITRSKAYKVKSWEDDSYSEDKPAALTC